MSKYILCRAYVATFSPRDDAEFVLKDAARPHVGRRMKLNYSGIIEGDRPRFVGEHEFTLHPDEPSAPGLPVWFSERDLTNIERMTA